MKRPELNNEKGFILVLALITMLAMTLIGLSVVMNMNTDMMLARNERDAKLAFELAEAGIREAVARLHLATTDPKYIGELSTDANYRTTSWNTSTSCAGKNFGYSCGGSQATVDGLNYDVQIQYLDESNPEDYCNDVTGIAPNLDSTATSPRTGACVNTPAEVVMYGQDFGLSPTVTSIRYGFLPVYKIASAGTSNGTTRTIVAYIAATNLNTDTKGAINTNNCVTKSGSATPTVTGGIIQASGCACPVGTCTAKASSDTLSTYLGPKISPDIISMATEKHYCTTSTCSGAGDDIPPSGKLDGLVTNWGTSSAPSLLYINNAPPGDGTGLSVNQVSISPGINVAGYGMLIIMGDFKVAGNLTWQGLIYVFGSLTVSGNITATGGVMAGNAVQLNGSSMNLTYDQSVLQNLARRTGTSSIMVWKRL